MNAMTKGTATPTARCMRASDLNVWIARHLAGTKSIPQDASFFLLVRHYEQEAERRFDSSPELAEIMDRMDEIARRYGLNPQFQSWEIGMEPPEYVALQQAHDELYQRMRVDVFLEHGEKDLTTLYQSDPAEYERRREAGRAYFLEPMAAEDCATA